MTDYARTTLSSSPIQALDPTVNHDGTIGIPVNFVWSNSVNGAQWICESNAQGAAVWKPINKGATGILIGKIIGANMNVTTDQPLVMSVPSSLPYRVTKVSSKNALTTTSITTAHGGIYTAAAKGGTAIVADGATNFAGQTTTAAVIDLTVVTAQLALVQAAGTVLTLSLTAGQGAACTSDIYVFGDVYA